MNIGKLILLFLVVCLMFTGKTYSFLSDTETSSNNRFAVSSWWIQTTKAHFEFGTLNNTETITSPGDVLLSGQFMTDSDTVGLWHFNEGNGTVAYDETTNNNDGVINGATWTTGKYGSSLDFDGLDDYVEVPDSSLNDELLRDIGIGDSLTVDGWIKTTQETSSPLQIWGIYGGSTYPSPDQFWYFALIPDGKVKSMIRIDDNTAQYSAVSTTSINDGEWHHVAFVKDSVNLKLQVWVDGVMENEVSISDGETFNNYPFRIGGFHWDRYFNGIIDEVRVSNIAKTSFPVDYFTSGTFESRSYNTGISADFDTIKWNETLPANTDLKFQIATNTDNSTWNFLGPDGTSSTYYTDPSGETTWSDHDADQYIKFKAFLEGDTTVTPALHDVTIYYGSV